MHGHITGLCITFPVSPSAMIEKKHMYCMRNENKSSIKIERLDKSAPAPRVTSVVLFICH
jgi:hypothetical protein